MSKVLLNVPAQRRNNARQSLIVNALALNLCGFQFGLHAILFSSLKFVFGRIEFVFSGNPK